MYKKIAFIINPASGADLPVLAVLNRALKKYQIEAQLMITLKAQDAFRFAQEALQHPIDAIAVYGGDGTVMEVAQALVNSPMPLYIFPGGTANIMAKELGLSTDLFQMFEVFGKPQPKLVRIDMATCNQTPFMLRLSTGILADIVTSTNREAKDKLGNLAYWISGLQNLNQLKAVSYTITINDRQQTVTGLALMITNAGNIGLPGISLLSDISVTDGLLDVVVFQSADFASLIALASSTVTPMDPPTTLQHWRVSEVKVEIPQDQTSLLDDRAISERSLVIKVLPQALTIVT